MSVQARFLFSDDKYIMDSDHKRTPITQTPEDRYLGEVSLDKAYLFIPDEKIWTYPYIDLIQEISKITDDVSFDLSTLKVNGVPIGKTSLLIPVSSISGKSNMFCIRDNAKQINVSFTNETNGTSSFVLKWITINITDAFVGPLYIENEKTEYQKGEIIRLQFPYSINSFDNAILPLVDENDKAFDIISWLSDNSIIVSDGTQTKAMTIENSHYTLDWKLPSKSQDIYALNAIIPNRKDTIDPVTVTVQNKTLALKEEDPFVHDWSSLPIDLHNKEDSIQMIDRLSDQLQTEPEDVLSFSVTLNDKTIGVEKKGNALIVVPQDKELTLTANELHNLSNGISVSPDVFEGFSPFSSTNILKLTVSDQEGSSVTFPECKVCAYNSNHLCLLLGGIVLILILGAAASWLIYTIKQRSVPGNVYNLSMPGVPYGDIVRVDATTWKGRSVSAGQLALLGGMPVVDQDVMNDLEKIHVYAQKNGAFRIKGHFKWRKEGQSAEFTLGKRYIKMIIQSEHI